MDIFVIYVVVFYDPWNTSLRTFCFSWAPSYQMLHLWCVVWCKICAHPLYTKMMHRPGHNVSKWFSSHMTFVTLVSLQSLTKYLAVTTCQRLPYHIVFRSHILSADAPPCNIIWDMAQHSSFVQSLALWQACAQSCSSVAQFTAIPRYCSIENIHLSALCFSAQ